ncbi:MAG TPA: hypothetical protein VLM11_04915, partial [Streptosporangiaceae bacterium]|nr:hypothetical protein [Streptosporangiaceae bacterium]
APAPLRACVLARLSAHGIPDLSRRWWPEAGCGALLRVVNEEQDLDKIVSGFLGAEWERRQQIAD